MQKNDLNYLMNLEHSRIFKFLNDFEKALEINTSKAEEAFSKFRWNLEKHFFIEEKAIFNISGSMTGDSVSDTFELLKEHGEIIERVKNIEDELSEGNIPSVATLKMAIHKHNNFEDNVFYPELEKRLNEEQKAEMFERAREIIKA